MSVYNSRKRLILDIFQQKQGWRRPSNIAVEAGIFPLRAIYTDLLRFHGQGLLARRRNALGRLQYRLTPRGVRRLEWLRTRVKKSSRFF
jgi:predicted transcriptional regulator